MPEIFSFKLIPASFFFFQTFLLNSIIFSTLLKSDFPFFDLGKSFRSFSFKNNDQFEDFLYTGSILNKSFRRLRYTDIDMFVYPVAFNGEQISAKDYDAFFFDKKDETRLVAEPIFSIFQNEGTERFTRFDFVFSDSSGNTTNDLIEISGIEKSTLRNIQKCIETISREINQEKMSVLNFENGFNNLQIEISFRNILGNAFVNSNGKIDYKTSSKYESHLLKTLPLIYNSNYFHDDLLLSSFIQVAEYIVRNIEKNSIWFNYADLKYHLKFLISAFLLTIAGGYFLIPFLRKLKFGQTVRSGFYLSTVCLSEVYNYHAAVI